MSLSKLQIGIIGTALSFIGMYKDKEFVKHINELGKGLDREKIDKKIEKIKDKAEILIPITDKNGKIISFDCSLVDKKQIEEWKRKADEHRI